MSNAPTLTAPSSVTPNKDEADDEKVDKLDSVEDIPDGTQTEPKNDSSGVFGTTSFMDRAKKKAGELSEAVGKRARQVQHRSAENDAQQARAATERIFNEIGSTITGLTKSAVSMLVGGTYGTISGLSKSAMPTHAKTIQAAESLVHAGSWTDFQKSVELPDGNGGTFLVDRFEVELNEEVAQHLQASMEEGWFYTDKSATKLKMTDPDGNRVEAISNPLRNEEDQIIGVLAFVNGGPYSGEILLHIDPSIAE